MKRFLRILALWLTPTLGALGQTAAPARAAVPKRRSNRLPLAALLLAALLALGGQASAQTINFEGGTANPPTFNGNYSEYTENGIKLSIKMSNVDDNPNNGFLGYAKGWAINSSTTTTSNPTTVTITCPGYMFDLNILSLEKFIENGILYNVTTSKGVSQEVDFRVDLWKSDFSTPDLCKGITSFTITLKTSAGNLGLQINQLVLGNLTPIAPPSVPTGVTATAGDGQATVSVTPPANNGGAPISYTVTAYPSGITATGTQSPIVVTGLTNGTAYTFTVTASNAGGTSAPSAATAPAVTPFYKPDVLIVSDNMYDETQATAQLQKDFADRYDVTVSTTGVPANPNSYSQIYDVRVRQAITDNDLNQYYLFLSQAPGKSVFVAGERPEDPQFNTRNQSISKLIEKLGGGTITPPSKITFEPVALKTPFNTGASSISTVKFTAPGIVTSSGTGSFIATEADGTSGAGIYFPKGTLASATEGSLVVMYDINFTYDNVDNSIQKAFRANLEQVMAAGGTLQGPSASSVSLSATPSPAAVSAPVTLTATVTAGVSGKVQFIEDGKVFSRYTLENGVAAITTTSLASGNHTITAQYSGDAEHNASVSEALKLFIYTAPDAPTIGTATAADAKATVSFTPPASDGGSPITSYTVTATPEGTGKSATLTVPATGINPGVEHTLEVTGLTNGTRYTFTVTASNAALTSAPSAPATTAIKLLHFPEITWDTNTNIVYGTPLDEKLLNATADVPGTFTYRPEPGTVLEARDGQTIFATFQPADQNANIGLTAVKTINVAKATPAISWNPQTIVYGTALGEAQLGAAALPSNNSMPPLLGTFTYTDNSNALKVGDILTAGDHTLKVAFVPNVYYVSDYNSVEATATLTVQKATPTIKWDAPKAITYGTALGNDQLGATASYNGAAVAGTLTYSTEGKTLKAGDVLAAGDHPLKVTFAPTDAANYSSVEATVTLTVDKAPLTVTASNHSITKGEVIPTPSVSYSGFVNGEDEAVLDVKPTVTTAATDASNAGTYDIVAANGADDNYEFSYVKGTLTINKITPTISWAEPATITYGTALGNDQLSATADAPGTFTYSPAAGSILNAGQGQTLSVTFTPTDKDNYNEVKKTAAISVAKAPLTATASSHTITKGEAIPTLSVSYSGFVNGEDESVLDTKPTATTAATATSPVGEYATVAAGGADGNYELTYADGKLAILDKYIPVVTWAEPNGITYGTPLNDTQLNATASYSGAAVAGTFTYAPALGTTLATGKHELKVTFTPTDGNHYISVEKAVSITVAKAPLTATASSYSIREGEAIPALGITYSGFVNGDTEAMLDTKPTATTNATATSPTGVYSITVAGGADDSYELAYVNGKFTVSNPIVVDALQAPQPACEGDKLSLAYTLASGKPTEYQIVFDAKALAAGFDNSGYAALPNDNGTVTISIPARVADGTYQAALQLRDEYGNISELATFQVTINVSADIIVPKFGSVVLIDNHDGRFTGYQWYRNGSAIGGATNQFYKDPNGLSGTYYAQLKTATGQTVNTCSKALSLKKSAQASVSVYPNPARAGQELTVKLSGFADEELQGAVLSVYSSQGVPVLTSRKVEQENRITLTGTDGVYMGRITTADGQVLTFKVVLAN